MGEGLDTGDMISKIVIPISPTETGGSLFGKLAQAGADLLIKTLPSIEQELRSLKNSRRRVLHLMRL